MKRRDLFKMLATLAAVPFVAPLVAMCKPKADMSEKADMAEINDINRSLELMWHRHEKKHEEMYRQALAEGPTTSVCMPGMDVLAYDPSKFKLRPPPVGFERMEWKVTADDSESGFRIDVMDLYREDGTHARKVGKGPWEEMPSWNLKEAGELVVKTIRGEKS